ncbi:MAG: protease complex subunit PrcB family protein [Panacagrimonas sp.]
MRSFLLLIASFTLTALAGCAMPTWLRLPSLPGDGGGSLFGSGEVVQVTEAVRNEICNTPGGESEVHLLPNLAALQSWGASRNIVLPSISGKALPDTAYVVVEYGQRPNSGYGLAVSRRASLDDGVLLLSATFFEPQQGRWAGAEPSSPCVAVSLPALEYRSAQVRDQSGKLRTSSEAGAP